MRPWSGTLLATYAAAWGCSPAIVRIGSAPSPSLNESVTTKACTMVRPEGAMPGKGPICLSCQVASAMAADQLGEGGIQDGPPAIFDP